MLRKKNNPYIPRSRREKLQYDRRSHSEVRALRQSKQARNFAKYVKNKYTSKK